MKNNKSTSSGKIIGLTSRGLLTVFIALRACDVISWPWWGVLAPLWAWLGVLLLSAAVVGFAKVAEDMKK